MGTCPNCMEEINDLASRCPHCTSELETMGGWVSHGTKDNSRELFLPLLGTLLIFIPVFYALQFVSGYLIWHTAKYIMGAATFPTFEVETIAKFSMPSFAIMAASFIYQLKTGEDTTGYLISATLLFPCIVIIAQVIWVLN